MTDYQLVLELVGRLVLCVLLSLVIGFEQRHLHGEEKVRFGTDRTFALIGLSGYILYILMPVPRVPVLYILGMLGIIVWLTIFYVYKIRHSADYGITTFLIAMVTYSLGPMLYHRAVWEVVLVVVIVLLLAQSKPFFRGLVQKVEAEEFLTLSTFLVLVGILYPLSPDQLIHERLMPVSVRSLMFALVVVSALSYVSYLIVKYVAGQRGYVPVALLGGMYSSTATVISLARIVGGWQLARLSLIACGMMYMRVLVLLLITSSSLAYEAGIWLLLLGAGALTVGFLRKKEVKSNGRVEVSWGNPLDLRVAVFFAGWYGFFAFVGGILGEALNTGGLVIASVLGGLVDVNPVIMAVAQGKWAVDSNVLVAVIFVACAANNLVKGVIAVLRRGWRDGKAAMGTLTALAVASTVIALAFYS